MPQRKRDIDELGFRRDLRRGLAAGLVTPPSTAEEEPMELPEEVRRMIGRRAPVVAPSEEEETLKEKPKSETVPTITLPMIPDLTKVKKNDIINIRGRVSDITEDKIDMELLEVSTIGGEETEEEIEEIPTTEELGARLEERLGRRKKEAKKEV